MAMNRPTRTAQRGLSTLAIALLLLFSSSIVVFYMNRGVIFEQKTSANQMRSTIAFEAAEAGLEWATGMLNRPYDIQASDCSFLSTANISFRRKYIQTQFNIGVSGVPLTDSAYPGCKINGTALYCNCPDQPAGTEAIADPTIPSGVPTELPSFVVAFQDIGDPTAVRVISTGCTAQAGMCKPTTLTAASTGASDAAATVTVILKLAPTLRAQPSAALTCGTSCTVGGSYNIYNFDVASNGYLVNAGTTVSSGAGVTYGTIPGQPWQNAVIANDSSLSAISSSDPTCTNASMFTAYFGTTMATFAGSPDTYNATSCSGAGGASACGAEVNTAYNNGWRNFYFPNGMSLNSSAGFPGNTLGSNLPGGGVNLVSPGAMRINGNITINGLLFFNNANVNNFGTGTADINGAVITCAGYNNNGSGTLTYDSNALGGAGLRPGMMVRVPGSWRDY
jgi:hypothetical protein